MFILRKFIPMLIDLQLFALNDGGTNVTNHDPIDTGDLSPEMKTYYDMTLLDEAGPQLVHQQFGQKRPIPKNGGKTIEFRKFSKLPKATTPLVEGVTPQGGTLDVTAITATVAQYGYYIVQSDVLELTAIDNTIVEATKLLGQQAGLTIDTIVRNVLMTGTNVSYASKVAANGTITPVTSRQDLDKTATLTVREVKKQVTNLRAVNAPKINGDYVCIIHPYQAFDLMNDKEWIDAHQYASPEEIYNGEIGKIGGCRFVESTEAKIYKDDTCPDDLAVFIALFLGQNAYGVTEITGGGLQTIVKQKGSAGTADPLDQRSSVGWKAIITAEILLPEYLIRFESCGEYSDTAEAN